MGSNPYTLLFGKEPAQMIPRPVQKEEVIRTVSDRNAGQQVFMITGVRGAGKTVFMTEIAREFRKRLVKKGLADGSKYGCLEFTLPLFEDYVKDNYEYT